MSRLRTAGLPATTLVSRLRPVWPEPTDLRTRHVGRGGGTPYLVLPSMRRPTLLVPAHDRATATAIRRSDEGQRSRLGQRALAWWQRHGLLRLLPVGRVVVDDPDSSAVVSFVRECVPEARSVVVRLGRPRPGRAVVLHAIGDDGRSLAFAKCASGDAGTTLRREWEELRRLGPHPAPGVRAPRVLGFEEVDDQSVLVLEALVPTRGSDGAGVPVEAMRSLAARAGMQREALYRTDAVIRLRAGIAAVTHAGSRAWLEAALDRMLADLGDVVVETGSWHGDWVAWNMARDGEEVLLWDWEHHETGVPLGMDHLHHVAQRMRMRSGTSPDVEDRWVEEALRLLHDDWAVMGDAAEATIRCYLLTVNLRFVTDRQDHPGSPVLRDGWSRSLVERHDAAWADERATAYAALGTATDRDWQVAWRRRRGSRPLRVLHASEVHWGGVVTLLDHFVAEQVRAGHDVHVLAHPDLPDLDPGAHRVPWSVDRDRPGTLVAAQQELRRLVDELRPDVVHLHSWFAGALGRSPLAPLPVPVVYQPHAWSDRLSAGRGQQAAVRASERLFARRTDLLVANCDDELARGRGLGIAVPGRALGVAVDLTRFRPPTRAERAAARAALGIPEGQRLVLVLGRLTRQKGQDLLVPAWRAAPPRETVLALVGPGDPAFVADLAGPELGRSVLVPGGTDDVLPWLWAADVLALPSRYETVALVVAEAMATGLPVVATAVDGAAEVLRGGPGEPAGTVVPVDDAAALVHEVTAVLADELRHARESAAGPRRARTLFDPACVARRLEDAYLVAIARHQTARNPRGTR
ncbi:glycosyltransferase family 4 protein [Nocardioides coralli]|uniref:glycosyltransferase family 4 protein n=1 Tax=Nocardioides coralli TaxID=2872154 RepID=UPI001CA41382|nr:glycosyltransferase family 4 protein [Nocardioides coralli]QZY29804.1 glycosyltransferase family 4 protein [Nocardioides coralli]